MKTWKVVLIAAGCALISASVVAWAAQTNYLGTVFIADSTTPTQQLKVNSDGSINVDGGGGGGGVSQTDEATFTAGTSLFAPGGGFYQTTATSNPLTTGQQGLWQMTANRAGFVNLRNASGTEIGTAAAPVQVSVANTGANATALLTTGTGGTFPVTGTFWPYTLGQQLAASSVPIVLTAAQLSTLTPPAAITNYSLETGGNLATTATNTGTTATNTGTTNTNVGAPGSTACSTDTGSCNINALSQRIAQRISSLITASGSPFQAGGSIANTSFGAANSPVITNPTSTLTLPSTTTAYTVGQLVATSATAGSVVNPSFAIANSAGGASIPRLRLSTNDTTSTAWGTQTVQVDLWTTTPTWTNGDRGTWSPATGTGAHLGAYTCLMSAEYGDGAYAECFPAVGNASLVKLASGTSVYWSLQAVTGSGVTGASKVWTLTAELQN